MPHLSRRALLTAAGLPVDPPDDIAAADFLALIAHWGPCP